VSAHLDHIGVPTGATPALAIFGPKSRADCSLKRRVARMVCQPCSDRSQIRQVLRHLFWILLAGFGPHTRNVQVSCALRCACAMAKARQQHGSLHHTHPPPGPLYEHSCGGGEGSSSAATMVTSSCIWRGSLVSGSHRSCGYISLSSMRDFPDPNRVAVRSVDSAFPVKLMRTAQLSVMPVRHPT
jgi:hypothetical protein